MKPDRKCPHCDGILDPSGPTPTADFACPLCNELISISPELAEANSSAKFESTAIVAGISGKTRLCDHCGKPIDSAFQTCPSCNQILVEVELDEDRLDVRKPENLIWKPIRIIDRFFAIILMTLAVIILPIALLSMLLLLTSSLIQQPSNSDLYGYLIGCTILALLIRICWKKLASKESAYSPLDYQPQESDRKEGWQILLVLVGILLDVAGYIFFFFAIIFLFLIFFVFACTAVMFVTGSRW